LGDKTELRDIEVDVLAELMKNSRQSDRELAKILGVSQPTVTRVRAKLERSGIIKEYTLIPDFRQIGYQIMALVFMGNPETHNKKERAALREAAGELEKKTPQPNMTVVNGIGLGKGRLLTLVYRDYGEYTKGLETIRSLTNVEPGEMETFLVDLCDESLFRVLSMKQIALHLQTFGKRSKPMK
jgi:DNA-binding Lrp family transcriptional regulator